MWSLGLVPVMRRAATFCTRCSGLMVDYREDLRVQLGDIFTSRATDLTQLHQLKEARTCRDNFTDAFHTQLSVEVDAEFSYDRYRLDDVITD